MQTSPIPPFAVLAQAPADATPGRIVSETVRLLVRLIDWLHGFVPGVDERAFDWAAGLLIIAGAILLRRVGARLIFGQIRHWTGKTETGLEERLFTTLIGPVGALLMVCGIYAALTVLKLPEDAERFAAFGAKVAARGILLWGVFCAGVALLGHYERTAARKDHGITAFMPLIKRVLAVVFAILAALIMAQTLGANVGAYLTGLGIGGLAFALAAQDTIANMFGSFAVVFDHAFRIGDTIKVAEHEGQVEDIGLRSTRLRTGARTQVVMPNKLLASETLINLSRMPQRRVDQAIGLTYATGPDQMQGILEDFRRLLREDPGVHPGQIVVNFVDYGESSLDIQIVYFTSDPDWQRHLEVRERVNLKIMRAVEARKLAFAFPTQTVIHENADE
jgi:MscS family membrane protein